MLAKLGSGGSQVQKPGMCHEFIRNCLLKKSSWQNRKERPNQSTNNGYMAERAKCPVRNGVSLGHVIRGKHSF